MKKLDHTSSTQEMLDTINSLINTVGDLDEDVNSLYASLYEAQGFREMADDCEECGCTCGPGESCSECPCDDSCDESDLDAEIEEQAEFTANYGKGLATLTLIEVMGDDEATLDQRHAAADLLLRRIP